MRTDALSILTPGPGAPSIGGALQTGPGAPFDSALRRALAGGGAGPGRTPRQAAEEFVAFARVQPLLASLRDPNDAAEPFAPGDAERRLGPLLDAEIAHRIVKKSGYGLVSAVEAQLTRAPAPEGPDAGAVNNGGIVDG